MSVSALVELADDPGRLARRLRRPVPLEPAPELRRGTAFHEWLERFFRGEALVDVRDLPGAGDFAAGVDEQFDRLREQFLTSAWAGRVPTDIEVPFATRIAGIGIRGRIDAVFTDPDGGITVVDWKTGRPPPQHRRAAVAVQLACYRLAMAELSGVELGKVRAAFHYVPTGTTLAPCRSARCRRDRGAHRVRHRRPLCRSTEHDRRRTTPDARTTRTARRRSHRRRRTCLAASGFGGSDCARRSLALAVARNVAEQDERATGPSRRHGAGLTARQVVPGGRAAWTADP